MQLFILKLTKINMHLIITFYQNFIKHNNINIVKKKLKILCRIENDNDSIYSREVCQICNGTTKTFNMAPCSFCNETGLRNKFSDAFIKNHVCFCAASDKKNCPICKKKCHHETSMKPRILIA